MKKIAFVIALLPLSLIACSGGNENTDGQEQQQEAQATEADLETVEETKTIEAQVERVNQDVDSILNSLEK